MIMLDPYIGKSVLYANDDLVCYGKRPCAAIITHIHSTDMVNLTVFDPNGNAVAKTSVQYFDNVPKEECAYGHCYPNFSELKN